MFLIFFEASSCEDALDINKNPNNPTEADVQLVLPQAIVASASISNQFTSYGGHFGGFIANAGGFSGFGNLLNNMVRAPTLPINQPEDNRVNLPVPSKDVRHLQ